MPFLTLTQRADAQGADNAVSCDGERGTQLYHLEEAMHFRTRLIAAATLALATTASMAA